MELARLDMIYKIFFFLIKVNLIILFDVFGWNTGEALSYNLLGLSNTVHNLSHTLLHFWVVSKFLHLHRHRWRANLIIVRNFLELIIKLLLSLLLIYGT